MGVNVFICLQGEHLLRTVRSLDDLERVVDGERVRDARLPRRGPPQGKACFERPVDIVAGHPRTHSLLENDSDAFSDRRRLLGRGHLIQDAVRRYELRAIELRYMARVSVTRRRRCHHGHRVDLQAKARDRVDLGLFLCVRAERETHRLAVGLKHVPVAVGRGVDNFGGSHRGRSAEEEENEEVETVGARKKKVYSIPFKTEDILYFFKLVSNQFETSFNLVLKLVFFS